MQDRWTFQIVEDYDDNYWSLFRDLERSGQVTPQLPEFLLLRLRKRP